jgi:hypothetical protein
MTDLSNGERVVPTNTTDALHAWRYQPAEIGLLGLSIDYAVQEWGREQRGEAERRIVEWLRAGAVDDHEPGSVRRELQWAADAIERGEHRG